MNVTIRPSRIPVIINKRILKNDDSYLFLTSASNENSPIRKLMPPYNDLTSPLPTLVVIAKPTESTKPAGKKRAHPPR
jgi:hypothetical protein